MNARIWRWLQSQEEVRSEQEKTHASLAQRTATDSDSRTPALIARQLVHGRLLLSNGFPFGKRGIMRAAGNWRVIFRFEDGDAYDVELVALAGGSKWQ